MEIQEFLTAKKEMESEIQAAVVTAVAKFRGATGYTPELIHVHMINRTLVGDSKPQHVVGQVKAGIEL